MLDELCQPLPWDGMLELEDQMSIFAIFPGFFLALAIAWLAAKRHDAAAFAGILAAYVAGWFVVFVSGLAMSEVLLTDGAFGVTKWAADDWQAPQILAPVLEEPMKFLGGFFLIAAGAKFNQRKNGQYARFMPVAARHFALIGFGVGLGFAGLETLYGYALPFAEAHGSAAGECLARLRVGTALDHGSYAGITMVGWYLAKLTGRARWVAISFGCAILSHSMHNALTEFNFLLLVYPLFNVLMFFVFWSFAKAVEQKKRDEVPDGGMRSPHDFDWDSADRGGPARRVPPKQRLRRP